MTNSSELKVSWSGLTAFLSCPRNYELGYIEGIESKPSLSDRSRTLGTAFHAGVAAHLLGDSAFWEARKTLAAPPVGLETMYAELAIQVVDLLEYYLPRLARYKAVKKSEVIQGESDDLAVEWGFEVPFDGYTVKGIIDAVVRDTVTGELVIMDWKLRQQFTSLDVAQVDGQLHFYAAALKRMGGVPIDRVVQWQFRSKLPSPASISLRNSKPNTGAESYDTTWERWCATLPAGIVAAEYEELMRPKMKDESAFSMPCESLVTEESMYMAECNTNAAVSMLKATSVFPAVMSAQKCQFCPFVRLCSGALRYGGDVTSVIDEYYQKRVRNA